MTGDAFFGKFRGTVTDNQDPLRRGRIRAVVYELGGEATSWALPCLPPVFFVVPAVGAGVWIEFEQGDPNRPIWTGCWFSVADPMPQSFVADPRQMLLQTPGGHSIHLDDSPDTGGITLHTAGGQTVAITGTSIEITNGSGATVVLHGPTVSVNSGALEVT